MIERSRFAFESLQDHPELAQGQGFVDRVFSRSWNGLWNAIKVKRLA